MPNPADWATIDWAARKLGCHRRTVARYIDAGTLAAFRPMHADGERVQTLLWTAQVLELVEAKRVLGRGKRAAETG